MSKYHTIPVSKKIKEFLFHCKNKARANSYDELFQKVGASLWAICTEMEKEHNSRLWKFDHEGNENCYIYDKIQMNVKKNSR